MAWRLPGGSFLITAVVASAVGLATLAGAWAVQAASLPPPERSDVVAARAVSWLVDYRLVESRFRIGNGPLVDGRCLQFALRDSVVNRGFILRLDDGVSLVELRPHQFWVEGTRTEPRGLPLTQLELAGCSPVLVTRIGRLIQSRAGVRVERSFAAGRPALALRVPTPSGLMVVYLAPRTYRPIAVSVTGRHFSGFARIWLTHLTPGLLHLLDDPRR